MPLPPYRYANAVLANPVASLLAIWGSKAVSLYHADYGVTVDGSNGVSQWDDQVVATGNNVTQSDSAKRLVRGTGSDGHYALIGDGTQKFLERIGTFTGLAVASHPWVYVIIEWTGADNQATAVFDLQKSAAGDGLAMYHTIGGDLGCRMRLVAGGPAQALYAAHAPPTGLQVVKMRCTDAGASSRVELSLNDSVVVTTGAGSQGDGLVNAPVDLWIGGAFGEYSRMKLHMIGILNAALTAGEETSTLAWFDAQFPSRE